MITERKNKIDGTLDLLFKDSKYDHIKMMKVLTKKIFRPIAPSDFKDAYLSISKEQGKDLALFIKRNNIKNIVEFGTSFGISTLYLAKGALETGGNIITTELIESKARKAIETFENAGVNELIEVRIGDAIETLKNHTTPIDLLLLDGWKDLYLPIFRMLEPNFHSDTYIYVDNADMADSKTFLKVVSQNSKYQIESKYDGKVVMISLRK